MSNMYDGGKGVKTWNPFKGCAFNCSYCKPSFQAQAKRQKHNCMKCYRYEPHTHPERLTKIPNSPIVFACGNGDVAFCDWRYLQTMLTIASGRPKQTFYFQSKRPSCFRGLTIPDNVILVTTLETDFDRDYPQFVSDSAPLPYVRWKQFESLKHPRKIITIEPIMDFGSCFAAYILAVEPEAVWIGYNSRPKQVKLPEPPLAKTLMLIAELEKAGIPVHRKTMREAV